MKVTICLLAGLAMALGANQTEPRLGPNCGTRTLYDPALEGRIVGGSEAQPNSWPWMAVLFSRSGSSWRFICGASLITNDQGRMFVLTAAHCVSASTHNQGGYQVRVGVHRLDDNNEPYRQILNLGSLYIHNQYSSNTFSNDIAIFSLSSQPQITPGVSPVCLAKTDYSRDIEQLATGEQGWVTGWGRLSSNGALPGVLHEVSKPIVSDATCSRAYGNSFIAGTMMCGGNYQDGGVDACQGDSGGPFVARRGNTYEQVGVVSWGYGCASPGYPGVYADVYKLRNWVSNIVGRY